MTTADRLKAARHRARFSRRHSVELMQRAEHPIALSTLQTWETPGHQQYHLEKLAMLCWIYQVSLDEIAGLDWRRLVEPTKGD